MTQWVVSTATIAKTSLEAQIESPSFASAQHFCVACGSNDLLLVHRYWSCCCIRLLIWEAFSIIQQFPDLQGWVFRHGLNDDTGHPGVCQDLCLLVFSQRGTEESPRRPSPCLKDISLKVAEPPSFQQLEIDFCIGHFIEGIILKRCSKEDEEKMWASQEKKIPEEGAGDKQSSWCRSEGRSRDSSQLEGGLCAERTSQSGKERQFGDIEICSKEKMVTRRIPLVADNEGKSSSTILFYANLKRKIKELTDLEIEKFKKLLSLISQKVDVLGGKR
ncbi:hypothetical protein LAZ67_7002701 [Cordylochernes scorpioides]|uniref:Uncharacterized protein n=1 Tax=Cordylochernes scorpioides TaxID=51811 RepID=A0ABY6KQA9_9ARAC|nr:hypothetical protein LAZ67_7002701 [Cordylochernes scorpioides]